MKYQHYEKYVKAADDVLANLPEVFTAKEYDEIRTPIRNEADNKWQYQTMSELDKSQPVFWGYRNYSSEFKEWREKRDKAYREYKNSIPVTLQTLRKHGFITVDHKESITIIADPSPWWRMAETETTYYYDNEEVSEKIYNKMKKYEPEKCRKVEGDEVAAFRYYYRVDWDALNDYLYSDDAAEGFNLLSEIEELETVLAELRKECKEKCPHWDD